MSHDTEKGTVVRGTVVEALANAHFRVLIDTPEQAPDQEQSPENQSPEPAEPVIAYLAGKMRLHRIRVIVGDSVELLLDPYGGKPRIIRRL